MTEDTNKDQLIAWLKTKTKDDIKYVKKKPGMIWLSHPEVSHYDAEKLVEEPDMITSVEQTISHEDRLDVIKAFSKKLNTEYIILDPFYADIDPQFKGKVAIVTMYRIKCKT